MTLVILLVCAFPVSGQEQAPAQATTPTSNTIPAEAAHRVNPTKPTAKSLAHGKKSYRYDCAMCHGDKGDGKGEIATSVKLKMGDFTDPATLKNRTDGELFYIIKNGHGQMLPEGDRIKPTELWNIVNYIRSLSSKKGQ